jgi:tungstate transport system permease protein
MLYVNLDIICLTPPDINRIVPLSLIPCARKKVGGFGFLVESLTNAVKLIFSGDAKVYSAVLVSLQVSCASTVLCTLVGVPVGFAVAVGRFRGRQLLITLLNTLMALPTVVVGLFVYAFITRRSVLGPLDLLFTKKAMILGQFILVFPIVVALTNTAVSSLDRSVRETAITLGAGRLQTSLTMLWEGRFAVMAAIAAAFGRVIGEVGISMILGGNIAARTRNITTAIALETSKGEFSFAMALGIMLLLLALGVNFLLRYLQGRGES